MHDFEYSFLILLFLNFSIKNIRFNNIHTFLRGFFTIDFGNEKNNRFKQSFAMHSLVRSILSLGVKELLKIIDFF